MGDEDREIAHDVDGACAACLAYGLPLLEEEELGQLVQPNSLLAMGRPPRDRGRIPPGDVGFPQRPRRVPVFGLYRHEEGEVLQPAGLRGAETLEPIADVRRSRGKALEHSGPKRLAMRNHRWKVDRPLAETDGAAEFGLGEEALLDQKVETDQQGIAGKRGKTLVRRIAEAGRAERQHLPEPLPGLGEDLDELVRVAAEIADAKRAGE